MKVIVTIEWDPADQAKPAKIKMSEEYLTLKRFGKLDCIHDSIEAMEIKYQDLLANK